MIYVDTYKCHICGSSHEVVHTGKPTLRDFSNSELLPTNKEKTLFICFDCESEDMAEDE